MIEISILFLIILAIYLAYRNTKTFELSTRVIKGGYNYLHYCLDQYSNDEDFLNHQTEYKANCKKIEELVTRYSYIRMVFDFRPLKLESWYEQDEVNLIEKYENYR